MRLHTFLVAPRHCRIHHIGQHAPDHYGEQRRRMRACRERSRYSTALCVNHFMLRPMIKRKNGTVRFLPRKGQASSHRIRKRPFIRQELPPRGLPTRRKPREEEEWRSGGKGGQTVGVLPLLQKGFPPSTDSTLAPFYAFHVSRVSSQRP